MKLVKTLIIVICLFSVYINMARLENLEMVEKSLSDSSREFNTEATRNKILLKVEDKEDTLTQNKRWPPRSFVETEEKIMYVNRNRFNGPTTRSNNNNDKNYRFISKSKNTQKISASDNINGREDVNKKLTVNKKFAAKTPTL